MLSHAHRDGFRSVLLLLLAVEDNRHCLGLSILSVPASGERIASQGIRISEVSRVRVSEIDTH